MSTPPRSRRGKVSPPPGRPTPPRGPFVLPQDRPKRPAASDADSGAAPGAGRAHVRSWRCGWMCDYDDAPEWSKFNDYIHTGYRKNFGWRGAVRSVRLIPPPPRPRLPAPVRRFVRARGPVRSREISPLRFVASDDARPRVLPPVHPPDPPPHPPPPLSLPTRSS